ncbi:MAG: LytTR family DNA-binding domain-containing protein [Pseudomonadota bacterium]|nr:LytTR family DNA-binding domain-containing protein [Pseudomonadota bacterium]
MNPTALIAEDESLLAAGLQADLAAVWPDLQVVAIVGDGASALHQTLVLKPTVCFFDIRMPAMTGLEAAQALVEDWPEADAAAPFPLLVFVTAYDQYALQAFEAQAVDYLVKPIDRSRLAATVQRLQARLAERSAPAAGGGDAGLKQTLDQLRAVLGMGISGTAATGGASGLSAAPAAPERLQVIQAQTGNLVQMVPVEAVIVLEAADKYVRVLTADREHLIRMSLRELLPQLDPALFWQVHRGTVVQARCIQSAHRDESGKVTLSLTQRQEKIPVSRLYAPRFKGM